MRNIVVIQDSRLERPRQLEPAVSVDDLGSDPECWIPVPAHFDILQNRLRKELPVGCVARRRREIKVWLVADLDEFEHHVLGEVLAGALESFCQHLRLGSDLGLVIQVDAEGELGAGRQVAREDVPVPADRRVGAVEEGPKNFVQLARVPHLERRVDRGSVLARTCAVVVIRESKQGNVVLGR